MRRIRIRPFDVMYWIAIIMVDIFVFFFLGLLMMGYDDNYTDAKGEYWSFASMNAKEKLIYIAYILWITINVFALLKLLYMAYQFLHKGKAHPALKNETQQP